MPRLQVSDAENVNIPGRPGRKKLAFKNPTGGATVFWGYESTITANFGDTTCGVPLYAGNEVQLVDASGNQTQPIFFRAVSGGGIVYYTEG